MPTHEINLKLSQGTLHDLRSDINIPAYDRRQLPPHTVHIGVGGFHRAHQAVYLDDLLALPHMERWGECGMGVLTSDAAMRDALTPQDCLYTVVERSASGQAARVIGSMTEFIYAPDARDAAIEKLAHLQTRIVSLTVTEGGYFIDEATGEFVQHHPAIKRDLLNPAQAETWIGMVAEALDRRRGRGLPPFTIMSCDNLQGNGHIARKVLLAYTACSNPALERWIAENVAFPNSMVDRITPATTAADRASLRESLGIDDAWPVVTEPFRQWVMEDSFCNGRPRWEEGGALMSADVASYEIMKMRLLNGSHLAMAYLAALHGIRYVHEILADPLFFRFIESFMEEVTPVVPSIPGTSVAEYKRELLERFSNPTINDQVTRICSEGSAKIPKWLLPSMQELLDQGGKTGLLSLVLAGWFYYLGQDTDEQGRPLEIIDARAAHLRPMAKAAGNDPTPLLAERSIFGERLSANKRFVAEVEAKLQQLQSSGVEATLREALR